MPRLTVRSTPYRGDATVELSRLRTTIGRSAINDLCIEDPFASRLHAEIRRREEGFRIYDVGSANGTLVNGIKLQSSILLLDGDSIRIGETEIEYSERAATSPTHKSTTVLYLDSPHAKVWEMTIPPNSRNSAANLLSTLDKSQSLAVGIKQSDLLPDETLAVISELSLKLLTPLSLEETLKQVLEYIFKFVPADRGYLTLLENTSKDPANPQELVCKAMKIRKIVDKAVLSTLETKIQPDPDCELAEQNEIGISRSISDQVMKHGTAVLTSDAQQDPRFNEKQSIMLSGLRSVIAVPVAMDKRILGMIYIDSVYQTHKFTERDLKLVTLIAGVAAIRIDNARLMELQNEQRRLANELATASEIQLRLQLQPDDVPSLPGYELLGYSFPCYEVGGDYYDFIERQTGNFSVALGDVSGKGTAAALLMSSLHAAVRAHAVTGLSAKNIIHEINKYICHNTPDNRYVTLFYSEINTETNILTYINAGHNAPIIVKLSGEIVRLDKGGFPLGILLESDYDEDTIVLDLGDNLIVYSDGVTESQNEQGEEFGEARLIEAIQKSRERSAAKIRDRIDEALTKFTGKARSVDDLTLVILKRS